MQAIAGAKGRPLMTDRLAHTLLSLAGIACPYYREESDVLSPRYDSLRPRVLKNSVDYNKLKVEHENEQRAAGVAQPR